MMAINPLGVADITHFPLCGQRFDYPAMQMVVIPDD
ncbi:hypothetical protein Pla8534_36340 [Lignipirellula cremea]|uniref:Uncharacterized protein n=1 Tax=Lignipirellula cremea TaxID=2528010 RepID=A0A518DVF3_9BACT|nr:hypothetical protein Pla8534_36340 [Lignipirellula cremea]